MYETVKEELHGDLAHLIPFCWTTTYLRPSPHCRRGLCSDPPFGATNSVTFSVKLMDIATETIIFNGSVGRRRYPIVNGSEYRKRNREMELPDCSVDLALLLPWIFWACFPIDNPCSVALQCFILDTFGFIAANKINIFFFFPLEPVLTKSWILIGWYEAKYYHGNVNQGDLRLQKAL